MRLAVVSVLGAALLPALANGAVPERAWITSPGPLSELGVSKRLRCEVRYQTLNWWQSPWGCATAAKVDGTEFGLIGVNTDGEVDEDVVSPMPEYWDGWTPVSQSAVGGSGTRVDPFKLTTKVRAASTGVTFEQTDRYVTGDLAYSTSVVVENGSSQVHQIRLYRSGKCFLGGSEYGYGRLSLVDAQVGCMAEPATPTSTIDLVGLTPGSQMIEGDGYGWPMSLPTPIESRCSCTSYEKNGLLLSWEFSLQPGESRGFDSITALSQTGQDEIPIAIRASDDSPSAGDVVRYTVSAQDTTGRGGRLDELEVQIPPSAHLVPGSVRAASLSDPVVRGSRLTFSNPGKVEPLGDWQTSFELEYSSAGDVTLAASAASANAVFAATDYSASVSGVKRPETPGLIAPTDGARVSDQDVTFSWRASKRAQYYDVVVDGARENRTTTSEAVVSLTDGPHNWHVIAVNDAGSAESETRTVTVAGANAAGRAYSEIELLRKFMPNLFFHHDEKYMPLDADWFLRSGEALGCSKRKTVRKSLNGIERVCADPVRIKDPTQLTTSKRKWLEFDTEKRGGATAIFGHADKVSPTGRYRYLDYWWFLRNNVYKGGVADVHAGDWEGMYLAVPNTARPGYFAYAGFAAHENTYRYLPDALRCAVPGAKDVEHVHEKQCQGRVNVNAYPAYGSHATYPRRCAKKLLRTSGPRLSCKQTAMVKSGVMLRLPEGDFDGGKRWVGNGRPDLVRLLPSGNNAWTTWSGQWSRPGQPFVKSPGRQDRFNRPFAVLKCTDRWSGNDRSGRRNNVYECPSATVADTQGDQPEVDGCDDWFGPMITAIVCDRAHLDTALAEGQLEQGGQLSIHGQGLDSGSAPGLAQAAGEPLRVGQTLTVDGIAPATSVLSVTAATEDGVVDARFTRLGLEAGGTLTVTPEKSTGGGVTFRVAVGGRSLKPVVIVARATVPPQSVRSLVASSRGGRVIIRFRGRGVRALVRVRSRNGWGNTRSVALKRGNRQRIVVKVAAARRVEVRLVDKAGLVGAARIATVR